MSGIFNWFYNLLWRPFFGSDSEEITSAIEVPMSDQKQSSKTAQGPGKTTNGGSSKGNQKKNQKKSLSRKNSSVNNNSKKPNETKSSPKENTKVIEPVEIVPLENLNYIDNLCVGNMIVLCTEVEKKVKNFWGPLIEIEPLKLKIEKLISVLNSKFIENESAQQHIIELDKSLKLLEDRSPMIESTSNGLETESETEEKKYTKAYNDVCQIGMRVFKINRQLNIDDEKITKTKAHIKIFIQQFIKCQTDLDGRKIDKKDKRALESKEDILYFCNEVLGDINKKMELM